MAEAVADPRRGDVRQGLISKILSTLAQMVQWLLLSLIFSIIVEWAGMVLWWPEEGLGHSRKMLAAELGYLDADFRRSVVTSDPARFAQTVADNTYYGLFEFTRIVDALDWLSRPPAADEEGLRPKLHRLYRPIADFVIAAMQITQVFSVRLAILTLATPVFVLFTLVALVDGYLILCRNLAFTYFATALQAAIARRLAEQLLPEGVLVLGIHESLPESVPMLAQERPWLYRKREE